MEFGLDLHAIFKPPAQEISIIEPCSKVPKEVNLIIDRIGEASARAQNLRSVITTAVRFFSSGDNKLYIKLQGNTVVGFLKIGFRKLFHTDQLGRIRELYPLCLLDFYVHENMQRHGYGKELYEFMLKKEKVSPHKIAIDRPSSKLLNFMKKHYSLVDFIPQNNHYVIYKSFFGDEDSAKLPPLDPRKRIIRKSKENPRQLCTSNSAYGKNWKIPTPHVPVERILSDIPKITEHRSSSINSRPPPWGTADLLPERRPTHFSPRPPPWGLFDTPTRTLEVYSESAKKRHTTSSSYGSFFKPN